MMNMFALRLLGGVMRDLIQRALPTDWVKVGNRALDTALVVGAILI